MNSYETPQALKHDAHELAEEARNLLKATAELTDEKIAQARERLIKALDSGKELSLKALHATDEAIQKRPYRSLAIAFGIGAVLGTLLCGRSSSSSRISA